jgi:hypothetical protein
MALGVLAGLTFLIIALVIYLQDRDWPARYLGAGVTILAVVFVLMRRAARRR